MLNELKIKNEEDKESFLKFLINIVGIPYCKNCGNLFRLGFPDNEVGICDYIICHENNILCECENFNTITKSLNKQETIDISNFYIRCKIY